MGTKSMSCEKTVRPWFICRSREKEVGMMTRPGVTFKSIPARQLCN